MRRSHFARQKTARTIEPFGKFGRHPIPRATPSPVNTVLYIRPQDRLAEDNSESDSHPRLIDICMKPEFASKAQEAVVHDVAGFGTNKSAKK